MKPKVKTSHAIVVFNGKLLLLLRDNLSSIPNPNSWSLVGGVLEKGENFDQALRREMAEEIGLVLKDTKYLGKLSLEDGKVHAIYLSKMTFEESKKVRLGNEGQRIGFFTFEETKNLRLAKELSRYFKLKGDYIEKMIDKGLDINPKKLGLDP